MLRVHGADAGRVGELHRPRRLSRDLCAHRPSGEGSWYAAGLNNKDARQVEVDTSFLGTGTWKVEAFVDTKDGDVNPCAYRHTTGTRINVGSKMVLNMAPGGGFVVKFTR